ncbi:MAG: flagellar hook-basal body complex protein [Planctomycetaceae bacterium]|nr:flagellar hook-basal body complex protein [Planctomycetaceae bacterium]
MANSLMTGVSGLATHQKMIEVVGHNLANLNTTGFKARRAVFSDVFYETVKGGSGGALGAIGGSNPAQIGNGSKLSTIGTNFSQGNLEATGSAFDFAIDGDGFFVVDGGNGPLYTRAGVSHVDQNGYLVDSATGFHVQRFGTVGQANGLDPAFQSVGSSSIRVPLGATVPGQVTTQATLVGNLSPTSAEGQRQELHTASPFLIGGNPALATTLLNDLDNVTAGFQPGDVLEIDATDADGSTISHQISVDGSTTVGDVINAMNHEFTGGHVALLSTGALALTAEEPGPALLSLRIGNGSANTGQITLANQNFVTSQIGRSGEIVRGGVEVFDERGDGHLIGVSFERMDDGTWTMTAEMDRNEGTLVDNTIEGITFGADGSFESIQGPDTQLRIQFPNQANEQQIQFNFGSTGSLSGLTSIAGDSSIATTQDGYAAGSLVAISVDGSGLIEGIGSNGRRFELAQMAIASFRNPHGLNAEGNNFFAQSIASGDVELGVAGTGGRGRIQSGQLEASNVDIAVEFTRLIVAQRGFSANARTITVTDEVLEELNSLIR